MSANLTMSVGLWWACPIRQVLFGSIWPPWLILIPAGSGFDTALVQANHHHRSFPLRSPNGHRTNHRKTQETFLGGCHHRSRPRRRCRIRLLVRVFRHPSFTELKYADRTRSRYGVHLKSCKPKHPPYPSFDKYTDFTPFLVQKQEEFYYKLEQAKQAES